MTETPDGFLTLGKIRASTIKNRRKVRKAPPEVYQESKIRIPKAFGVYQKSVRVFRSRIHALDKCKFIIHCAFPLTKESQAFSVLQLIKMRAEVRLANHHCQAYILKGGQYCTDDGVSKVGGLIKGVMTEVRATGVACVVSVFSYGSRKKFRVGRILAPVQRMLLEVGRKGFVMSKHKWGVGRLLGGTSVPPCKLRTVTLSSIQKRMPYSVLHALPRASVKESNALSTHFTKRAAPAKDPVICAGTSSNGGMSWPPRKRVKLLSSVNTMQGTNNFTNLYSDPMSRSVCLKPVRFHSKAFTPVTRKFRAEILEDNMEKESMCATAGCSSIEPKVLPVVPKYEEPSEIIEESSSDESLLPCSRKPKSAIQSFKGSRESSPLSLPLKIVSSGTKARSISFHHRRHSELEQNTARFSKKAKIGPGVEFESFHKLDSEVESSSSLTSSCVLIKTREGSRSIRFSPVKRTMQSSLCRFTRSKR